MIWLFNVFLGFLCGLSSFLISYFIIKKSNNAKILENSEIVLVYCNGVLKKIYVNGIKVKTVRFDKDIHVGEGSKND
jgi:hypothetical protein